MSTFSQVLLLISGAIGLGHLAYSLAGLRWGRNAQPATVPGPLPPVTLLRPLKQGVPRLREKLELLAGALRPEDQLILGVDEGSPDGSVAASLQAAFPQHDITVVHCRPSPDQNPKIAKLVQMMPSARHAHLILSDSESLLDRSWLDAFRSEWETGGAAVLTCGYRFLGATSAAQRLDVSAPLLSLWPGLVLVQRFSTLRFTLGACTGFRRAELEAVGGWAAFASFLAEDNRLGAALAARGARIALSRHLATLDADPLDWTAWWRHQRRVAVTYRVCDPAGFAPMILTHGSTAALVWLGCGLASGNAGVLIAGGIWAILRGWIAACLGARLGYSVPGLWWTAWIQGWMETVCWVLAWLHPVVFWSGRWWRIDAGGHLAPRR